VRHGAGPLLHPLLASSHPAPEPASCLSTAQGRWFIPSSATSDTNYVLLNYNGVNGVRVGLG
jgi:hypothetical protein